MTQPFRLDGTRPAPLPARPRQWTPAILTQLVVVLAVLVSGVTGAAVLRNRSSGDDVLSVVQAASTSAATAKTYRSTFEMNFAGPGMHLTMTGTLLSDLATKSSSGQFSLPGVGRMEIVQVGNRGYFKLPKGPDAAGHHWLAVVVPGGNAQSAIGGQDPTAFLKLLAQPKGVKKVGDARVNGVDTTHYRVKLDIQRVAQLGAAGAGIALPPGATDAIKKDMFTDVWIDDANRPRRLTMSFEQDGVSIGLRVELRDYDKPVTVTPPAASDVTGVATLAELGPRLIGR